VRRGGGVVVYRFDILANGGGSVTLHFQRQPFRSRRVTVFVPWNRIMVMDVVTMTLDAAPPASAADAGDDDDDEGGCETASAEHDYNSLRPSVVSLWRHSHLPACSATDTSIIPETQVHCPRTMLSCDNLCIYQQVVDKLNKILNTKSKKTRG